MVNTSGQVPKAEQSAKDSALGSTSVNKKKKKPNRQRNRIRNKRNRNKEINCDQAVDITSDSQSQSPVDINNLKPSDKGTLNTSKTVEDPALKTKIGHSSSLEQMKTVVAEMNKQLLEDTSTKAACQETGTTKTREQIMADREAKKLAKQAKKTQVVLNSNENPVNNNNTESVTNDVNKIKTTTTNGLNDNDEKTREKIKAERDAKKVAKQAAKAAKTTKVETIDKDKAVEKLTEQIDKVQICTETELVGVATEREDGGVSDSMQKKKPPTTKAERRALQEAQRAAKVQVKSKGTTKASTTNALPATHKLRAAPTQTSDVIAPTSQSMSPVRSQAVKSSDCKVKLFNHLESTANNVSLFINNSLLHPSVSRLGEQYARRTIVGSNARCIAFLNALKMVVQDFETPPKKEFARSLETTIKYCVDHLQRCRPLAVSVINAHKQMRNQLTQLPTDKSETDLKEILCHFIDTYIENQIGKAALAISTSLQDKIADGDVILTFGCSSLINYICEEAKRRQVDFRVIVVDSRPFCEGQEQLRRLTAKEIPCTYVLINAVSFVMPEATKVLLGAHALLSNGYVMARTGTAQVALVARSFNVPVLVCCETHKFSERFQTDAIVYNELGDPDDMVIDNKCCLANWQARSKMSPLNLNYDITPPELVTAVVTEVSILPCTSVPVILRIKPDIGY